MKKKWYKTYTCLLCILLLPFFSLAQDDTCDGEDCIDTNTPIDSWLLILLIAGVVYGFIKFRRQQQKTAIN